MISEKDKKSERVPKKDPQFESFKNNYFDEVGQNKGTLFNFFLENNHVLRFISPEDEDKLVNAYQLYLNRTFNWTAGSFLGVLLTDQVVFRYAFPNFRISSFRGPLFLMKYIGVPFLAFGFAREFMCKDINQVYQEASEKYNFRYEDYQRAMKILERAHMSGKLQELFDSGAKFDWSNVPELPEEEASQESKAKQS